MAQAFDIVFAVCHPDDETLWVGGLLAELSKFDFLNVHVICLSGRDAASPRIAEFEAARSVAGYASGIILGKPLRDANQKLPPLAPILEEGLRALGVTKPDLVITHSPFGDEHRNPHHRQAFAELLAWSRRTAMPFGFFSCAAIPHYRHVPVLEALRRKGSLQLVNLFRCAVAAPWRLLDPGLRNYRRAPDWLLQFQVDGAQKARMLEAYASIGLAEHRDGYAFSTSVIEQLYLFGRNLPPAIAALLEAMPAPTAGSLFAQPSFLSRLCAKLGFR